MPILTNTEPREKRRSAWQLALLTAMGVVFVLAVGVFVWSCYEPVKLIGGHHYLAFGYGNWGRPPCLIDVRYPTSMGDYVVTHYGPVDVTTDSRPVKVKNETRSVNVRSPYFTDTYWVQWY